MKLTRRDLRILFDLDYCPHCQTNVLMKDVASFFKHVKIKKCLSCRGHFIIELNGLDDEIVHYPDHLVLR